MLLYMGSFYNFPCRTWSYTARLQATFGATCSMTSRNNPHETNTCLILGIPPTKQLMFVFSNLNQFPTWKQKLKSHHFYHLFVTATLRNKNQKHQGVSSDFVHSQQLKTNPPISWQQVSPLLSYEGEGLGARPVPGAKLDGEEYAVSSRENPGLGTRISQQICSYQAPFVCVFTRWRMHFVPMKGCRFLLLQQLTPKHLQEWSTWISQDLLHTSNCDSQVGWAVYHWLKKQPRRTTHPLNVTKHDWAAFWHAESANSMNYVIYVISRPRQMMRSNLTSFQLVWLNHQLVL